MLEFKKKKLDYTASSVSVLIFRLYGVTYMDFFVGDEMYEAEEGPTYYA